jgi:23S rRNA (uracil1939-C5)-methyltransferase
MDPWQQGATIDITMTDLTSNGDGVGPLAGSGSSLCQIPYPATRIRVRLTQVKPAFARGKLRQLLEPSPRPGHDQPCIVADKCGGCQWQAVSYSAQLGRKTAAGGRRPDPHWRL